MPSLARRAAIAALFLSVVVGSVRSQELAPPDSGVSVCKVAIETAYSRTVKYYVKGGSPRLQGLVRRVEWVENELSVIEQLQLLKLETVINERRGAAGWPTGNGGDSESSLRKALSEVLASEATPEAALQLIGLLEQLQIELDSELRALSPHEQKVAKGPVDDLRPRLAALARRDAFPLRTQTAAPRLVAAPQVAPAIPQPFAMSPDPSAFQQMVREHQERVRQQMMQTQHRTMQRHYVTSYAARQTISARPPHRLAGR